MKNEEIYHRTYLPDGSYGRKCNPSGTRPSRKGADMLRRPPLIDPREFRNGPATLPDGTVLPPVFQKPAPQPIYRPEPYKPGQLRWKALRYTPKGLTPIFMVEKEDQDFARFATPFEMRYCKLPRGNQSLGRSSFEPVVEGLTVVGHVGRTNGQRVWCPIGMPRFGMQNALEEGVPLYAADKNPDPNLWIEFGASEVIYTVLTGIDGEIVAALGTDYVGLESVDFWLLDAVFLGKGLADLGIAVGKRLLGSLTRRAVNKLGSISFRGATREIAESAMKRLSSRAGRKAAGQFIPESGMTRGHFEVFRKAAQDENLIAVVRNTNMTSTRLIERGCPGKPFSIKFHTDARTGVVTAQNAAEIEKAYLNRYFVVDADGVARRPIPGQFRNGKPVMEELQLKDAFWPLEKGQVIDPRLKKPLVGDYDLMGVVDPSAPGRNIALAVSNNQRIQNVSSPIVERFMGAVNPKMDMPRVLHGAQDQFAGFRGGATAFLPDGSVKLLPDEAAVEAFYRSIGRETIRGSHPRPPAGAAVVDELAARRARTSP